MNDEEIKVEEEFEEGSKEQGSETDWTEEFKVAGDELLDTLKKLVHEAGVRRIVVKNKDKRILIEIPLVLGLAGIVLLPVYSALALSAALATDCTILVERSEPKAQVEEE
jgi:hypothetical protein